MTYTILFEIILKAVSFAVLIPLYYTFINVAVKLAGITYLSKETVRKFFRAPSTYAFLFIMIFFAAMVIMVDVSGINYAYHRSNYLKKSSPIRMLFFGFSSALRLLRPRNMPVIITLLTYIPVMGYVVLTFHFLNIRAPYIVDLVSINMRLTIACVGIYVILLFYSLKYTFIIHAYNIEHISFRKSIDRTKELLKGKRVKIIGGLILWCIVTIGIPAVVDHFYTGAFLKYIMKATSSIKATSMVYEAVKIVMGLASTAPGLLIGNLLALAAQLRHNAAYKGRGILQVAQYVYKAAIVQAEASKVLDLLHRRVLLDQLVIDAAQAIHDAALLAGGLHTVYDLIALLPILQKGGNHFHRVLEVCANRYDTVASGLEHTIVRAVELAEILHVEDGLDPFVSRTNLPQQRPGIVRGTIVDEENFIVVPGQRFHLCHECLADGHYVLLFIIAGHHDADFFL